MPRALAAVFGVVSFANQRERVGGDAEVVRAFLARADEIFAVLDRGPRGGNISATDLEALATSLPEGLSPGEGKDADTVKQILALRFAARRRKDFAKADELRKLLASRGIEIDDKKDGVRWRIV
jgi:cysteinyl-tRNA synthetase